MLIRFNTAALSGTHMDRNTGMRTTSESSSTAAMNQGIRDCSLLERSTWSAELPVTSREPP